MAKARRDGPLGVKEAYDAIGGYARSYGELPLRLLLHAAVPQSFRADLLNLLKVNFVPEAGGDLSVDADVLLSPLVETTAGGYFLLDPEVRRQSLDLLDAAYRSDGRRRSIRVARFLLAWLDRLENPDVGGIDPLLAEYAVIQRWVALALIDPPAVARSLADSLKDALEAMDKGAVRARLGGIAAALSVPLTGYPALLAYAEGVDALRTGNTEEARQLLAPLGDSEIRVGDVTLRPAAEVLNAFLTDGGESAAIPAPTSRKQQSASRKPTVPLINVPPPPELLLGREGELATAQWYLVPPRSLDEVVDFDTIPNLDWIGPSQRARTLVLAGTDGIGKYTLARFLATNPVTHERYGDGVVWLSLAPIEASLARLGMPAKEGADDESTRTWLAERSVLFIGDARETDIPLARLYHIMGPKCAVLYIGPDTSELDEDKAKVHLEPLTEEASTQLIAVFQSWSDPKSALVVRSAAGNPLLVRLLNNSLQHMPHGNALTKFGMVETDAIKSDFESSQFERLARRVESIASSKPQEACRLICEAALAVLNKKERDALFGVLKKHRWRTQLAKATWEAAWSGGRTGRLRWLIADDFGDMIRVHPLVCEALQGLFKRYADGPLRVFWSYSHKDEPLRDELHKHLAVLRHAGLIADWHDRKIGAGKVWKEEIDRHLGDADVVLLLVSASFLASDYCWGDEMAKALARHAKNEARVIPVILRPCDWQDTPIAQLQAVPKDAQPITQWGDRDVAYLDVASAIRRAVKELAVVRSEPRLAGLAESSAPLPGAVAPPSPSSGRESEDTAAAVSRSRERETAGVRAGAASMLKPKNGVYIGVDPRGLPDLAVFKEIDAAWYPEMVLLPAGQFWMGSPEEEAGHEGNESPRHRVMISRRCAIGRFPVTFDEYDHFCEVTRREKPSDAGWGRGRRPVVNISWVEATAYCEWLAKETGREYRLPSEAEWEYACRAGTTTPYSFGDHLSPEQANYWNSERGQTTAVGTFPVNPWGLSEMHGNVWEWCADGLRTYGHEAVTDPMGPMGIEVDRAMRGGSFGSSARITRSAFRGAGFPGSGRVEVGFRVARSLED